jgi:pSer/pThr/pTyr-binding forkhead associated (FHA) protein
LETLDDIRRWTAAAAAKPGAKQAGRSKKADGAQATTAADDDAQPYRPRARPPLLLLCVVDEGADGGEWRRVRGDRAVIGRAEGDIVIPHDNGMSGRHAELRRVPHNGRFRWLLRDLKSTNGTFIGATRLRFEVCRESAVTPTHQDIRSTSHWQATTDEPARSTAALVELHSKGPGDRHPLTSDEVWIGSDAGCQIVLGGDPFVSRRHARLTRNRNGRWEIENHRSRNGTWLRITEIPIDATGEFQAGEQRFLVRVC